MTDLEINNNINININFIYHMDFDFIKVITIKNIFNEIDYLVNIYNNKEIKDIIIKIFIYYKKYNNKLFESYINLLECLSKLEYIDHYEYLKIIINIIQILLNRKKVELLINDFNTKLDNKNDYINISNFNIKIKKFITSYLSSNNFLKNIILFLKNNNEEQINNISTLLATEYYMYYNGLEMYNLFCFLIKNGKSKFIKNYDSIIEKINNLNDNNNSIITKKYKYNFKNNNIKNLIETLIKINNII
jgi:hypothetical protein